MVNTFSFLHHICLAVVFIVLLSANASAREIRVGIGFALPPYVIRESNSGLEVDLVRNTLKRLGHDAVFVYLPNLRLPVAFAQGEVDCVVANKAYDIAKDSGCMAYPSDTTIAYRNFAISLKRNRLTIKSIEDLAYKRVLGFNNATKYLGSAFATMAEGNPSYTELADQSLQVRMLYSGRTQVVISDQRIFLWWRQQLLKLPISKDLNLQSQLEFYPIFSPALRRVYFCDEVLRNEFNSALESMRKDGECDIIIRQYVGNES